MRIIRGKYGRRRFDVPRNITARPTTDFARENIFNVLENLEDFDGKSALDLFSGTGAIALEFLSRGCDRVVAVEMAATQANFIRSVKEKLNAAALTVVKGDVFKYVETCSAQFDFIFADPPYDHPRFAEIPELILNSQMLKPGTWVIVEHNKNHDFSALPHFEQHRTYGSVNFSLFHIPQEE
ncbi:MAG: 16S rRNA (guanine(966)-N(2))-methyltransferase RsmD [Prevotella sp.]|nr:16S rRNA (guanine(966)-N(2))-methyltransferase RsmD [Prevotella sp.]MCM1074817.1 16S rRNA (guanine(966)-N(2))-methyltransferase RsmD [Ruminococcus sp.]